VKIAIGTVQWGLKYGISNRNGITNEQEIRSILKLAEKNGISYLDTAEQYGLAEQKIGKLSSKTFNIITKGKGFNNKELIKNKLENSLQILGVETLYGYLFHDANELLKKPSLWDQILYQKKKKKIKKIGFSVYNIHQVEKLINKKFIPDIVQLPYSIFDRRFESLFKTLKNLQVEIHVRSIFLQGLYFLNPNSLPKNLIEFKNPLIELIRISDKYSLTILELALAFVSQKKIIDYYVIGIDKSNHLREIIDAIKKKTPKEAQHELNNIKVKNCNILNPNNW